MINQQYLNYYFGNIWHKHSDPSVQDNKSGLQLLNKIYSEEWVLDVGCGRNSFKGKIKNLVGIDPAFETADVQCSIEDFQTTQRFDVAFCLGSINFGDQQNIENQISKVVSLLRDSSRIYWRCNPGRQDHPSEECREIVFYPWSIEEHVRLSNKFGFILAECCWEQNGRRIYAEWIRKSYNQ